MPNKVIKNVFNAGELSEYVSGRGDLSKYYNGCSKCVNATVLPYGGMVKRSGTEFIAKAKGYCRIISFEFSADDTMIIELGNLYARFYKDGDRVMTDSATISDITETDGTTLTVTTSSAHGFSAGDVVRFTSVGGATELNFNGNQSTEFTLATVADTTHFTITIDTTGITAWTSGGTVAAIYELTTTISESDLFDLHYTPSADVIYIANGNYLPKKLSRLADNNWTISDEDFIGGPFLTENSDSTKTLKITGSTHTGGTHATILTDSAQSWETDELVGYEVYNITDSSSGTITANTATTITVDALTGGGNTFETDDVYIVIKNDYYIPAGMKNLTLTATGHTPFLGTANDIGTQWQLSHTRADNESSVEAEGTGSAVLTNGDFTLECSKFGDDDYVLLERKQGNGEWQQYRKFTSATAYSATEEEKDVYYRITTYDADAADGPNAYFTAKNQTWDGVVKVTAQISTSAAKVTATTDIYYVGGEDTADNETSIWSEGAWGLYRGYPRTLAFYENRLWYAGTTNNPQTLWGSKSGLYDDFTVGNGLDSDSVQITIQDSDVSNIQWLASENSLIAGTTKKEYKISANNTDDPITPSDAKIRPQTSNGSSHIQPVLLNNSLFYAQGQGRKIRAMLFTDASQKYDSDDATLLSNHMFESPPVQFATQRIPDSILWVVRSDGTLCSFSYEPKEEVAAWTRHVTGGMLLTPSGNNSYFKSIASIRGTTEDDLWAVVLRTINGSDVYYIEKFSTRIFDQLDEAVSVDCAKVETSGTDSQDIVYAADTVRYGIGIYGSGIYGAT